LFYIELDADPELPLVTITGVAHAKESIQVQAIVDLRGGPDSIEMEPFHEPSGGGGPID
jgi:hypothetical protein